MNFALYKTNNLNNGQGPLHLRSFTGIQPQNHIKISLMCMCRESDQNHGTNYKTISTLARSMTRLISIILLSGFLFQSFSKVLILANYEMNKEYITKNFCENKNKPKMHCNGKCHLKKQLEKDEKRENAPVNNVKEKLEIQLFPQFQNNSLFHLYATGKFVFAPFNDLEASSPSFSIFHPPSC